MTNPKKKGQSTPGMRHPQGQQKKFNLHIDMPHIDLMGLSPAAAENESTTISSTPAESTPVELTPVDLTPVIQTGVRITPVQRGPGFVPSVVPFKKGELRIPNSHVWFVMRTLPADERGLFDELYLWIAGFGLTSRRLSKAILCETLHLGERPLNRLLRALERRGLVRVGDTVGFGPRDERGTMFTLTLPEIAQADDLTPVKKTPVKVTPVKTTDMKREEEKEERKGPTHEEIQTAALRLNDPAKSRIELLDAVQRAYAITGVELALQEIDQAITFR